MSREAVIRKQIFEVDELCENSFNFAYEEWLKDTEYFWSYDNIKTLREFEKQFPIKLTGWEYDSNYGYVYFDIIGKTEYFEDMQGLRLRKYLINNHWDLLFTPKEHSKNGKTRKSNISYIKNDKCSLTGFDLDCVILEEIRDFVFNYTQEKYLQFSFSDLMDICMNRWVKDCIRNIAHFYTKSNFTEMSIINDWEYLEDGSFYADKEYEKAI